MRKRTEKDIRELHTGTVLLLKLGSRRIPTLTDLTNLTELTVRQALV
jgi:hypothetical protein